MEELEKYFYFYDCQLIREDFIYFSYSVEASQVRETLKGESLVLDICFLFSL